jgi:hypothetical protein
VSTIKTETYDNGDFVPNSENNSGFEMLFVVKGILKVELKEGVRIGCQREIITQVNYTGGTHLVKQG